MSSSLIQQYQYKNYQDDEDNHSDLRSFESDFSLEEQAEVMLKPYMESVANPYDDSPTRTITARQRPR